MMKPGHRIDRHPNMLGAMFAVWNDRVGNGVSQQDVHVRTFPALQLLSDKLWKGENADHVPYSDFERLCKNTPEAPGVNLLAQVKEKTALTSPEQEVCLTGNDSVSTVIPEIGYPYAVEFEICPDPTSYADAVLFKGPHSEWIVNWHNTGKFAFRRDGYEMIFHDYRLPAGEWTKVRVEGDVEGTSLYINGELKERLQGRVRQVYNQKAKRIDSCWYRETLIFPLKQIGDPHIGFKGKLKNVVCIPLQPEVAD